MSGDVEMGHVVHEDWEHRRHAHGSETDSTYTNASAMTGEEHGVPQRLVTPLAGEGEHIMFKVCHGWHSEMTRVASMMSRKASFYGGAHAAMSIFLITCTSVTTTLAFVVEQCRGVAAAPPVDADGVELAADGVCSDVHQLSLALLVMSTIITALTGANMFLKLDVRADRCAKMGEKARMLGYNIMGDLIRHSQLNTSLSSTFRKYAKRVSAIQKDLYMVHPTDSDLSSVRTDSSGGGGAEEHGPARQDSSVLPESAPGTTPMPMRWRVNPAALASWRGKRERAYVNDLRHDVFAHQHLQDEV